MIRKSLSLAFIGLMLYGMNFQTVFAQSSTDNEIEKIKTDVRKRGTGNESKVVVTLKNGTKLEGNITQILDDSFDLTVVKTKHPTTVPYRDVAKIKRQGMSKGAKRAIGIGVVAGIVVLVLTLPRKGRGFCPLSCPPR